MSLWTMLHELAAYHATAESGHIIQYTLCLTRWRIEALCVGARTQCLTLRTQGVELETLWSRVQLPGRGGRGCVTTLHV